MFEILRYSRVDGPRTLGALSMLVVAFTLIGACAFGEDDSNQFYEQNYASSPLQSETIIPGKGEEHVDLPIEKRQSTKAKNPEAKPAKETNPDTVSNVMDTRKGVKVKTIGGILNARDSKHFEVELGNLLSIATQYDLDVGKIYSLGHYDGSNGTQMLKVIARGGSIEITWVVPEEYQVTRSPTWILDSEDGQIVLEAPESLKRYFNTKGEFIEGFLPATQEAPLVLEGLTTR